MEGVGGQWTGTCFESSYVACWHPHSHTHHTTSFPPNHITDTSNCRLLAYIKFVALPPSPTHTLNSKCHT